MWFQGEYETLKMIEQGGRVHCGTDYTEGELLIYLIKKRELISKEQLFTWLNELCTQLDAYHRCRHRAYQYVNPYAILISDDDKVKLLDLESQDNESILIYMQKNIIRESFGRQNGIKRAKIYTDYYSFGKTLQFIMAHGNIYPEINIIETHIISKIIRKCLKEVSENQYQNIKEIQNQIPKTKQMKKRR
ncbi:MAG: hypothetical protein R3Y40_04075 [Eubacteriales bacterium]